MILNMSQVFNYLALLIGKGSALARGEYSFINRPHEYLLSVVRPRDAEAEVFLQTLDMAAEQIHETSNHLIITCQHGWSPSNETQPPNTSHGGPQVSQKDLLTKGRETQRSTPNHDHRYKDAAPQDRFCLGLEVSE